MTETLSVTYAVSRNATDAKVREQATLARFVLARMADERDLVLTDDVDVDIDTGPVRSFPLSRPRWWQRLLGSARQREHLVLPPVVITLSARAVSRP